MILYQKTLSNSGLGTSLSCQISRDQLALDRLPSIWPHCWLDIDYVKHFLFSAVDGGEADHFLGQDSPPPDSNPISSASTAQLFAAPASSTNDSFAVGFGNAPPQGGPNQSVQSFQTADGPSSTELHVEVGAPPPVAQQAPPHMQPHVQPPTQHQPQFYQRQQFPTQPMQSKFTDL